MVKKGGWFSLVPICTLKNQTPFINHLWLHSKCKIKKWHLQLLEVIIFLLRFFYGWLSLMPSGTLENQTPFINHLCLHYKCKKRKWHLQWLEVKVYICSTATTIKEQAVIGGLENANGTTDSSPFIVAKTMALSWCPDRIHGLMRTAQTRGKNTNLGHWQSSLGEVFIITWNRLIKITEPIQKAVFQANNLVVMNLFLVYCLQIFTASIAV